MHPVLILVDDKVNLPILIGGPDAQAADLQLGKAIGKLVFSIGLAQTGLLSNT